MDNVSLYIFLALLVAVVVVVVLKTAVIVPNKNAYIVERLGKFSCVLNAGFHILVPFVDKIVYKVLLKEEVVDVPEQMCITKDNVSVTIDGFLYLQVISPDKACYGIDDYKFGAMQLAQTALRSAIGKMELDKTFEERSSINQEVVEVLDAATASWGVKVLRYELRDITPPSNIMQSMEKQMRAEREKRAMIAQSEGEKQAKINHAEGEKAALIAESEGQMQAVKNQAEAEANKIRLLAEANAQGIEMIAQKLQQEGGLTSAQIQLAEEYIKQFGNIAKETNTVVVPTNLADVATFLQGSMAILGKKN